jgi:hypothetical protein
MRLCRRSLAVEVFTDELAVINLVLISCISTVSALVNKCVALLYIKACRLFT